LDAALFVNELGQPLKPAGGRYRYFMPKTEKVGGTTRFEKRIQVLEAEMLSNPVVLRFADGSTRELSGRRYFLVDLFARGSSAIEAQQLDLIRKCVSAEEPGGGRIIEAMQALLGPLDEPVDEMRE
jgi:hypothetical protein